MSIAKKRYPPKYWNDFANVENAIREYLASQGTPDLMPTRTQLKASEHAYLASAIDKHGSFPDVAARMKLRYEGVEKKPSGYWKEFSNVARELHAFAKAQGTPGIMPSETALLQANQSSLVQAIHRHGHFEAVAQKAELQFTLGSKPSGYWREERIVDAILGFNQERGILGVMPKRKELEQAGKGDLLAAISSQGGFRYFAKKCALSLAYKKQEDNHWYSQEHVDAGVLAFIKKHGTPGVMPTAKQFRKHGAAGLEDAISRKHGGLIATAGRLGLAAPHITQTKPDGYWHDFENVARELERYIGEFGTVGVMPTYAELQRAEASSLCAAIHLHGGFVKVAQRLQLSYYPGKKNNAFWNDLKNVGEVLQEHNRRYEMEGIMPSAKELREHNYSSLIRAIRYHQGFDVVAKHFRLRQRNTNRPSGYWTLQTLKDELFSFLREQHLQGMPTPKMLEDAGRSDLGNAITKLGGYPYIAKQFGLDGSNKVPYHFWEDIENVRSALLQFNETRGTPGVMPKQQELRDAGHHDLIKALHIHGGALIVAQKLGLQYNSIEQISQKTVEHIEQLVRSIQPLAESNLLSGAQVLIIRRRFGMLEYRNGRIRKLITSLAHGDHEAIELALSQLHKAPDEEDGEEIEEIEEDDDTLQKDLVHVDLEAALESDLPIEPDVSVAADSAMCTTPDLQQEQVAIKGLSALGAIRLPLDEVLGLLTSKILWEAFYKRLYCWYGVLQDAQTVTDRDVQSAILSAYAGQMDNEFVLQAAARFTREVQQAINFVATLLQHRWTGPRLRLHQADAARRMADILAGNAETSYLLNADDPGMGKSASLLAAIAASGCRCVLLLAPKTVADDTWAAPRGEIHTCLAHATIVRGMQETLAALAAPDFASEAPVFFVLHYEELLNEAAVAQLAREYFDCLCVDEVHLAKQRSGQAETARREALETLRASARCAIGLTGTPLVNELAEPLSLLQLLSNQDPRFAYTRLSNQRMGDIADVFEAMLPHIIRRRKKDVLLHLPSCDVLPVEVALSDDLLDRVRAISRWPQTKASHALTELRKVALAAKLPAIRTRAADAKKLLVLTYLRDEVAEAIASDLQEFFPDDVGLITGSVSKEQRKDLLGSFRDAGGIRILVGTIGTIGVGLTLFDPTQEQTAHEIIVADLPYTAAEFDQGIARLHREGQKHRVVVEVLLTAGALRLQDGSPLRTIDQRIWDLIAGKRELSDVAIDGQYTTTDAAKKVQKALRRWLSHVRDTGVEPLLVAQRPAEVSPAQRWRGEIARLRGMSAARADDLFASADYTRTFLDHLKTSPASQLAQQWLRAKLKPLLRPDLQMIDMGCGLNPLADLPCRVVGLDRHDLPGQVQGKMENPPLPDDSADVLIYSLSLYGTVDDLRAYFTHAQRILRGGGHLLIVEPGSSFTQEGLQGFVHDLRHFGFDLVGAVREIRDEDGVVLTGMHLTLTGEPGKPGEARFQRKAEL